MTEAKKEVQHKVIEKTEAKKDISKLESKEDVYKMSDYLFSYELLPDSIKSKQEAFIALQTAMSLGFKTFGNMLMAIKNMYFVNGQVELWGDLPLAIVEQSGNLVSIDEYFIDNEYKRISIENKNLDAENTSCCVCY